MRYISTRGQAAAVAALEAVRLGLAPDGGLFVPEDFPRLDGESIGRLGQMGYSGRALALLQPFFPDLGGPGLARAVEKAYDSGQWDDPQVVPVRWLRGWRREVGLIELMHGPTCAFKDVGLQLLPHLLTAALERRGQEAVILVATSGDTGKAALAGFAGVPGTRIIVFYPADGVSNVQKRQMVTQAGENVHVVAVQGNFDDAQSGVKRLFADQDLAARLASTGRRFSSANSINWGRLAPQIVYYFSAYVDSVRNGAVPAGAEVNVVVPTGNFGNILAAYYAKCMGLPVGRFICASNRNHVLTDFLRTGLYDRNRPFYLTSSPSMDILVSSNLERLLFEVAGRDSGQVRAWMADLGRRGSYQVGPPVLARLQQDFWGGFADESQTRGAIREFHQATGYVLDPHTAVAIHVYGQYLEQTGDRRPALVAATASPFKFPATVAEALWGPGAVAAATGSAGAAPGARERDGRAEPALAEPALVELALLEELSRRLGQPLPGGLQGLGERPVLHTAACRPEDMPRVVAEILDL
ncbi:MAG: threonine synthase [Firmicutes bacterium]|nr:threonine synthase [Bacillota bacterium]